MTAKKLSGIGVVVMMWGCGTSMPPPNDAWAAAQADVGRAQATGAPSNPDAKLHLELAMEDLDHAKRLINSDNERATTLTEVARSEAQLALSLTKEAAERAAAQQARGDVGATGSPTPP